MSRRDDARNYFRDAPQRLRPKSPGRKNKTGIAFSDFVQKENFSNTHGKQHSNFHAPDLLLIMPLFVLCCIFFILGFRLFYVQIIQGAYYKNLSDQNRTRTTVIPAARGIIFDRYMRPLVRNVPVFEIIENKKAQIVGKDEGLSRIKEGKQVVYFTKIRAYVKILENREKGELKFLKANLIRYGTSPVGNSATFQENDEIQIRARINKDAYIHIFGIGQNGIVAKIYPNEYFNGELLSAEAEFIFPNEKQRNAGFKLKVSLPKGLSRGVETILIVASKEKKDFMSDKKATEVTVTDLMQELSDTASFLWTEETIGYEVRR